MKIENLKDLKKIMQLCKQLGVTAIKIDGVEFFISPNKDKPSKIDLNAFPEALVKVPTYSPVNIQNTSNEPIESLIDTPDALSDDQLLYYSAKGDPQ